MKKLFFLIPVVLFIWGVYFLYQRPEGDKVLSPRYIDYVDFPKKDIESEYFVTLKVGVVTKPYSENKNENIAEILRIIEQSASKQVDMKLIVFGEASLGLYNKGGDRKKYIQNIAEPLPGPLTRKLSLYAQKYNLYIASGLIEIKKKQYYNSLFVINPKGKIETVHRKMLLNDIDSANGIIKADSNYETFQIDVFKFGLALSNDLNEKWLYEKYKKEKIDALIYSHVSTEFSFLGRWLNCWPYSKMYNCWILGAGRYGTEEGVEYAGNVFISSPAGYLHYEEKPADNLFVYKIGK